MSDAVVYHISIPDGYRIDEQICSMDLQAAAKLLETKRRRRYTSVLREKSTAMLTRHIFTCPHCRRTTPAYFDFFHIAATYDCHATRSDVEEWYAPQISFFDSDTDLLLLNTPLNDNESHVCPRCGGISTPFSGDLAIQLVEDDHRITLSYQTFSLETLLVLPSEDNADIFFSPPITESVVFDFSSGLTLIRLSDAAGKPLGEWDTNCVHAVWESCKLYHILQYNTLVKRRLRKLFSQQAQSTFPFSLAELTPDRFALLTRFQGYPESFYHAIPYTVSTGEIDESFAEILPTLRKAKNLPALCDSMDIPKMKTVRRILFANPGLFFYSEECRKLWDVLADRNFFCSILSFSHIYDILSFLHQFPAMMEFFGDYTAQHGAKALKLLLKDFSDSLKHFAIQYAAMNPAARKIAVYSPGRFDADIDVLFPTIPRAYSIPVHTGETSIPDSIVGGYSFVRLNNLRDYVFAGQALHNCLNENHPSSNPIYIIKKGSIIQAAIELRGRTVIQARCFNNTHVEFNPNINAALNRWAKLKSLHIYRELLDNHLDV
ncbi:MAG: hypothetical protein IJN83_02935 [Clostridia bacterium]|nr:hypothetical protein [Clostridia bacterium]